MSLLLRPVPKSHGTEPRSRHIVPAAAPPQAPSHQLNPAPGTWTIIFFYLFSSGHFVPTISPTSIYKLCILNENEIHNRQPVIHKTFIIFKSFREAFKKQDQKDLSNLPSYRVINCYTLMFSLWRSEQSAVLWHSSLTIKNLRTLLRVWKEES